MRTPVLVALALAGGCGSSKTYPEHVIVNALVGDVPEANATVISHSPTGDVVQLTVTDAAGRAELGLEPESLVSVVFPGEITKLTPVLSVITSAPPGDGSELTIHGPPGMKTPAQIVGVLQLDGPSLSGATYFNVTLGCVTVRVEQLPANIDVSSCNLGSDQNLDVLVRGYHDAGIPFVPHLDGYSAARVAMTNGAAAFDVPAWETTGTDVALMVTGVQATLHWTMHIDGLDFLSEQMPATPFAFNGLIVDETVVEATIPAAHGARVTTRTFAGTPATVALADSDFLPTLEPVPAAATLTPATISWARTTIDADALNVHATWTAGVKGSSIVPPGPHVVVWNAILPTDMTSVALPKLDGDLQNAIAPLRITPTDVVLRAIDSSALDGFAELLTAGIRADETTLASPIVDAPADGQVRESLSIGTE